MLLRLAFRNLLRHGWRTAATVLGVALGIAVILATLSVGDNVRANLQSAVKAATGPADLIVAPGVAGRAVLQVAETEKSVSEVGGVAFATPVLEYRSEPVQDISARRDSVVPGVGSGFQLTGRDTSTPERVPAELSAGALPQSGSGGIAVGADFAAQRGLELGSNVDFVTSFGSVTFTVTGLLENGSGLGSTNAGRVGLVALEDLQTTLRLDGRASFLEVAVAEGESVPAVQDALTAALGETYTVTPPAGTGDFTAGVVDTLQAGLQVLAATLMALAGFMAYNTFAAASVERRREYALLRTVALTRAQVQRLALLEAGLLSVAGIVAGVLLGFALSYLITWVNAGLLGYTFRTLVVPFKTLLLASGVGALVSLAAGYLPARAASQTPPIVAARNAQEARLRERPVLGAVLLTVGVVSALSPWRGVLALLGSAVSMGLVFLGVVFLAPVLLRPTVAVLRPLLRRFGVQGKLGADFTLRNAARNGVAIGAVVVGVTLTVGVGGMVAGINKAIAAWVATTVVGDLFVTAPPGFPQDFEAEVLRKVPAIAETSGVGVRVVRFQPQVSDGEEARGRSVALVLVDPERFNPETGFGSFQYLSGQGDAATGYATLKAGGVLAANTLRERFGVSAGDRVSLRTSDGFRDFTVGGVVVDFTGGGEAFIGSLNDVARFGGGTPDLFVMNLKPGSDPVAVRDALVAAFPDLYLDVSLNQDYRDRILSLTSQTFYTTNALLALAVFIAALGVANTLGMNLSDRQRDIAVLRTLGLTRRGVRTVVMLEGGILVMLGTLLGVGSGVLLSRVITAGANALTGFVVTPSFPWPLVLLALVASPLVGLAASLLPARRASRLSPVVALGGAE
ncbi:FtsX-like permease family protein [soil metagenome]